MYSWTDLITRCFDIGVADADLELHIDEILSWYGQLNSNKDALAIELIEKYGEDGLRIRFEEFVDRLLVEKDIGNHKIFPLNLTSQEAKIRYRKLIRLFHPDRGIKDEAWLNYRAEKINLAYKAYSNHEGGRIDAGISDISSAPVKPTRSPIAKRNFKFRYRTSVWRDRFGDPELLQKKIVYGLTVFSLMLVAFFYASTREAGIRNTSNNLTQEAPNNSLMPQSIEPDSNESDSLLGLSEENRRVLEEATWLEGAAEENFDTSINQDTLVSAVTVAEQEYNQTSIKLDLLPETATHSNTAAAERGVESSNELVKEEPSKLSEISNIASDVVLQVQEQNKSDTQSEVVSFPLTTLKEEQASEKKCVEPSDTIFVNPVLEARVTARNLRLRSGAGVDCPVLIALLLERTVNLLKYTSDREWVYISVSRKSESDIFGWVKSNYVKQTDVVDNQALAQIDGVEVSQAQSNSSQVDIRQIEGRSNAVETSQTTDLSKAIENSKVQNIANAISESQKQDQLDQSIESIFQTFKEAYEAGDAKKLSDLYLSSARENKLRGKDMVQSSYRNFFQSNKQRNLEINISSVVQQDASTAVVSGVMEVGILNQAGGSWRGVTAGFNIMIIKVSDSYKIATFDWGV